MRSDVQFMDVLPAELDRVKAARRRRRAAQGGSEHSLGSSITAPRGATTEASDPIAKAHRAELVGLAMSGGGIRSATLGLGVLQSLARFGVLRHVDYLSTVSGGGYMGSWLGAWIERAGFDEVERHLSGSCREQGSTEPEPVQRLRHYSNYLTPKVGLLSLDTWSFVGVYLRNLLLNLFVIVPLALAVLLVPGSLMGLFQRLGMSTDLKLWVALACAVFALLAVALNTWRIVEAEHRPADAPPGRQRAVHPTSTSLVIVSVVVPLFIAAFFTILDSQQAGFTGKGFIQFTVKIAALYSVGWTIPLVLRLITSRGRRFGRALVALLLAAPLAGAAGGMVGWLIHLLVARSRLGIGGLVTLAPPLLILGVAATAVFHLGLAGRDLSDFVGEWWARIGGCLVASSAGWLVFFGLALYGPRLVEELGKVNDWLTYVATSGWLATTVAGVLTARLTGAGRGGRLTGMLTSATPYVFLVGLVVALSAGIEWAYGALTNSQLEALHESPLLYYGMAHLKLTLVAMASCLVIALVVSWRVDVNRFSMHGFYRNRLVRCYLGASNPVRTPNPFTGFDPADDRIPLAECGGRDEEAHIPGPYHIVNTALNLVSTRKLAWQYRKAASFVLAPLFCGSQETVGFCPTPRYANRLEPLSLGTAMAISGAAASPNMGYHSSPAVSMLMTLFDVRLGWWLPNPAHLAHRGRSGPSFALPHLFSELFGLTRESSRFIYLSDGGHFENLGLYELVRRRCRLVIAIDGAADPGHTFGDLANAIRRCRTDLGIEIEISVDTLRPDEEGRCSGHCAIGRIRYDRADDQAEAGTLLYVKASLTGNEPRDVSTYAHAHPAFPHQSTMDQWFDEPQFESYRALGEHMLDEVFGAVDLEPGRLDMEQLIVALERAWYPPSEAVRERFTAHATALAELFQATRDDPLLACLDAQFYPEWERLTDSDGQARPMTMWIPDDPEAVRAAFYHCNALIQLMETVYLDLNLESEYRHPDNRGWMNLFRHWSWSGVFRVTWSVCASTFGARFQRFCELRLGLELGEVTVAALGELMPDAGTHVLAEAQAAAHLNFMEVALLERFLEDNATIICRSDLASAAHILMVRVDDPSGAPENHLRFPFGFAVVSQGRLLYIRVQNHLRRTGLARKALIRLMQRCGPLYLASATIPPEPGELPSRAAFRRLFRSCRHEVDRRRSEERPAAARIGAAESAGEPPGP